MPRPGSDGTPAALSRGELLIFARADVEVLTADLGPRLRSHLERFDIVGVAGTTRLTGRSWTAAGKPFIFGQVAHPNRKNGYDVCLYGNRPLVVEILATSSGPKALSSFSIAVIASNERIAGKCETRRSCDALIDSNPFSVRGQVASRVSGKTSCR